MKWIGWSALGLCMACGDNGGGTGTETGTGTEATTAAETTGATTTSPGTDTTAPTTSDGTVGLTGDTTTDPTTGDTTEPTTTDATTTDATTTDGTTEPPAACGDGQMDAGEECDDGNDVDTDACTNLCATAICGDSIVQDGVEGCDDGNTVDGDGCSATCVGESCGDGVPQDNEECDDANDVDSDGCTSLCKNAICGDAIVHEDIEQCDDANDVETDACTSTCKEATCGDGFVQDGVEQCDDANADDTDACLTNCIAAECGDGFVQAGAEQCDDANDVDDDGCSNACELVIELKSDLLLCGSSDRDVATFIPQGVPLNVVFSCVPDANTQAMLVSRSGVGELDPAAVKAYVEGGGRVLTEIFSSDEVYNAVFDAGVAEVGFIGACSDTAPTIVQFTNNDPLWAAIPFQPITLGESGCGTNSFGWPGLTPLAGWSANEVAIGYRDAGPGRVWVTNFDWQDTNTVGPAYAYTEQMMGYMITGIAP